MDNWEYNSTDKIIFDYSSRRSIQNDGISDNIMNNISSDFYVKCKSCTNSRVKTCMESAIFNKWIF